MNSTKTITLILFIVIMQTAASHAQDTLHLRPFRHYKETALTLGYNYNFGDKEEGERPEALHFIELGVWRSTVSTGHHPVSATYYFANDFGLNTDQFVIGPKIGGFFSLMMFGLGGEMCYYTDFNSGSLRFIPSFGLFTPYFKLTINPHVPITNKDFEHLNKGHANLTIRVFKIKRTDLK